MLSTVYYRGAGFYSSPDKTSAELSSVIRRKIMGLIIRYIHAYMVGVYSPNHPTNNSSLSRCTVFRIQKKKKPISIVINDMKTYTPYIIKFKQYKNYLEIQCTLLCAEESHEEM